jgi:hypothetical protein
MVIWRLMSPGFFKGVTLPRRADLLLEPATASVAHFGLPDLSNLPEGETAIDPATGEEFTKGGSTPPTV